MMRSKRIIFCCAFVCLLTPIFSQEVYDLNKCITTGLEKNFSILIARNQQEIASNNRTAGNAGFLPSLELNGYSGGTINNTHQTTLAGEKSTIDGAYNTTSTADVTLDWTVFHGFNAITTYKKLNELKLVGAYNTQMAVENFMSEMVSQYYYDIQQIQLYHNLAYAVSLSRERVRIDQERYLLGSSSKLQLLQSQVYLNTDSSRLAKQQEVLNSSKVKIHKLMASDDMAADIILKDSTILINSGLIYDSLLFSTLKLNTNLEIARKNQVISEYDYKIISSRKYPYLNFSSAYNYNYYTYQSSTYKDQQVNGMKYGFTLRMNLFDGFSQRREQANAKIEIDNKQMQYQQVEQSIKADLITIYYAYQNNLHLLLLEEQNLKTAGENLKIALEKYKLGNLSGLELREVQQSLLDAEERLLSVQFDTKLAEISLLQISGRIMEYL